MVEELFLLLEQEESPCFIQTHDFPDPDAVASAYGLHLLLKTRGFDLPIVYSGWLEREVLKKMINDLSIPIFHNSAFQIKENSRKILVDGCVGNGNIAPLPGREIAVIDHHLVQNPDQVPYVNINPHAGACSSIIVDYYRQSKEPLPQTCASALMMGLLRDTDKMTRNVHPLDIKAYNTLYKRADMEWVFFLIRNNLEVPDLSYMGKAINCTHIEQGVAFCYLDDGCPTNLLGIISDFFVSLREVLISVVFAQNEDQINISMRSIAKDKNASVIMKQLLEGVGEGGGHSELAGGIITKENIHLFNQEETFKKLQNLCRVDQADLKRFVF